MTYHTTLAKHYHQVHERLIHPIEVPAPSHFTFKTKKPWTTPYVVRLYFSKTQRTVGAIDMINRIEYPRIRDVQLACCRTFELDFSDMIGSRRVHRISHPRQIAMAISSIRLNRTLCEIGRAFQRDHTSVLHASRKYHDLVFYALGRHMDLGV